jgi:hypothetical protein
LRKALGEDPQYIERIPKRGFVGAVRQLPNAAALRPEKSLDGQGGPVNEQSRDRHPPDLAVAPMPSSARRPRRVLAAVAATALAAVAVAAPLWWRGSNRLPDRSRWVPLTKLPDSATQPALSPDGRMLAFVRGPSTWIGPGQIYVKLEPVQLTQDDLLKADPTFSPDGTRIAYIVVHLPQFHWDTWIVPTLRGEPQPMMERFWTHLDWPAAGAVFGDQDGCPHGDRGGRREPTRSA